MVNLSRLLMICCVVFSFGISPALAGFYWGDECSEGTGYFNQPIGFFADVVVGEIPEGKVNVEVVLTSSRDIDVRLVDLTTPHWIVSWPYGSLSGAGEACTRHGGLEYCYSGYNGDGSNLGHEWIQVNGTTNRTLVMKAYGYAAGDALVEYAWGEHTYTFNDSASSFMYLETDLRYISEPAASVDGNLTSGSNYSNWIKTDSYKYILELDAQGKIVGGEWVGSSKKLHPDFLWMPTVKHDVAVAADAWDGSDGIKWSDVQMLLEMSLQ